MLQDVMTRVRWTGGHRSKPRLGTVTRGSGGAFSGDLERAAPCPDGPGFAPTWFEVVGEPR